jgi:lipopolysaccharide assembly outer membrane protein LptD (OstA)
MGYGLTKIQFSSAVEFRRDDVEQPDLSHTIQTVVLLRNNFKYQISPSWRMLGKLDYSISNSTLGDFFAGGYTQGVVGYAYRPVSNDRLNALVKYTYFYNVPTTDQLGLQQTATEFLQKSHIAALDVSYDLTANWSVGGKYAYRLGEASLDRTQPVFFNDTAQLSVLRVDWRFLKQWDTLVEVRQLGLPDLNQNNRGVLTALYRRISKNLRAGVGYNFTDFSDDLTDLKYNHRGVFFNIIGTK